MLREFESPAYVRIMLVLGMAIVGMTFVVVKFGESLTLRDHLLRWIQ